MRNDSPRNFNPHQSSSVGGLIQLGLKVGIPILILVVAVGIALSLVKNTPRPERQSKPRQARLVETTDVSLAKHSVTIEAWGHVQPAHQVTLRSQVEGKIIEVSPELLPGGRFAKHDVILRIDPSDYKLALKQRLSDLSKARAALLIEKGNQILAQREYDFLGEPIPERQKTLMLRVPQLNASKADIASAKAALESAKLALDRTVIKAPFDAMVLERRVDLGTHTTTATDIATLVGTDVYWVELAIPITQLKWIRIPQTPDERGSSVKLYQDNAWGNGVYREGQVVRLLTELETEGRMSRLLVEIQDPLNLHNATTGLPPVLLGTYLRAEIEGLELDQVAKVDRRVIRDNNTVWLIKSDNTLEIRKVTIEYRGPNYVLVSNGLENGERLIISDIVAAVEGMPLRLM